MTYAEKLKDPRWQRKRLEVMESAGWKCEKCGRSDLTLHVHHPVYIPGREPWDYARSELQCLCEPDHDEAHKPEALPTRESRQIPVEQHMLLLVLHFPDQWIAFRDGDGAKLCTRDVIEARILRLFLGAFPAGPIDQILFHELLSGEESALVASLLFNVPSLEDPGRHMKEAMAHLTWVALEPAIAKIDEQLSAGYQQAEDAITLLKRRSELTRRINRARVA